MDMLGSPKAAAIQAFLSSNPCVPAPSRPNTTLGFPLVDTSGPPLEASPSPFNTAAWKALLADYPDPHLPKVLCEILEYGTLVGYQGPSAFRLPPNLPTATLAPGLIQTKLDEDMLLHRVVVVPNPTSPFICSPLGLVPKRDGGFRRIHNLSHPIGKSVNDYIPREGCTLVYSTLKNILPKILLAGRSCIIIKKDIKDAFRNIPIAPCNQWLLGLSFNDVNYMEQCLPFGLASAPFIFNLFAEAFHWILESHLYWKLLEHYLDDFISIFSASEEGQLGHHNALYNELTTILGIPRNDSKDRAGTIVEVLGILVNTNTFELTVPEDKLARARNLCAAALNQVSLTLREAQSLTGTLSFCAQAVTLGWAFCRWDFIAQFPKNPGKRRIPAHIRSDIKWWHDFLSVFNGVRFFEETRHIFRLYTDASSVSRSGKGGFSSTETLIGPQQRLIRTGLSWLQSLPHTSTS